MHEITAKDHELELREFFDNNPNPRISELVEFAESIGCEVRSRLGYFWDGKIMIPYPEHYIAHPVSA